MSVTFDGLFWHAGTLSIPSQRGRFRPQNGEAFARQSLPDDPIGTFTLGLTNLVVGSSIQIESQDGTTSLYTGSAASSTASIALQAYAPGSALNSLRIKVRKGSESPFYIPYETLTTAFPGSQSIYVSQIPDE